VCKQASLESAEKCFLKAHEIYPNATNALHLAKAYNAMRKPDKYKEWLNTVLSLESVPMPSRPHVSHGTRLPKAVHVCPCTISIIL